jgi:protein-S-isoprenylcysteine O-methyltransferase Ste14
MRPAAIVAWCVTAYWCAVAVKALLVAPRIRKDPNIVPRERTGRWMRLVWVPVLALWVVLPWRHAPLPAPQGVALAVGMAGAAVAWLAFFASIHCWRRMGTSWRLGIDPREKTALVTTGLYARVRHPIYGLSIALMLGTLAAAPSVPMAVVAFIHIALLQVEARREESHLRRVHGAEYDAYSRKTGRVLPRRGKAV